MKTLLEAIVHRRSYYDLQKGSPVSKERICTLVHDALRYTPSSFNMQSSRCLLLFEKEHERLWDITIQELKKIVPEKQFKSTEKKILSFRNAYGTVLFFDEHTVVDSYAQKYDAYRENFPVWAQQSNGMLQYAVWTLLEAEGLGASLQHYNPLIDGKIRELWNVPKTWAHIAQMPFGTPASPPPEKKHSDTTEKIKIFGL